MPITTIVITVLVLTVVLGAFKTVQQGTVVVTTIFGKFSRILTPGLNFKIPIIERIFKKI